MFIILKLNRHQRHQILDLLPVETNHDSAKKPCSQVLQNQTYLGESFLGGHKLGSGEHSSPHLSLVPLLGEAGRNNSATVNNKL